MGINELTLLPENPTPMHCCFEYLAWTLVALALTGASAKFLKTLSVSATMAESTRSIAPETTYFLAKVGGKSVKIGLLSSYVLNFRKVFNYVIILDFILKVIFSYLQKISGLGKKM